MTCPRCSQPLSTLSFDGRAARYCERCGFVGVETVHERDAPSRESWDDAIARFHERAVREARERDRDVGGADGADGGESTDGGDETESERDEAEAEGESGDAAEDVADAGDDEADDEATDRDPSGSQLKNGEDGDRGDRADE
ncbi:MULTISPECIES: zinc finger domain-containing protein [unclassified Haloferax]|uniref:zinc finger domain-containing protein n=1 Tax=unclassified Haloferax TaxID=2625095 RepID=UPI0028740845|nr:MULTISPECIES: zinc finger domain-containing protein [unclassified Haloferax]MDS0242905.1 zf-TFIIB domain-containing protein [Haloferax sp. S2CR25]MDS0446026.1 zf-TFIIB domain-containing protein [Haloferax sp. S2CR25-2]